MKTLKMWDDVPGVYSEEPTLDYYPSDNKKTTATCVIFPGGGYHFRAEYEGKGYAEYLNSVGMDVFVCQYRVSPHRFPLPLLDARRAVRYVRKHAKEFGIDPDRVAVMGSSAGGHLAALVSNYRDPIDFENIDETDEVDPIPNATILCYPVIHHPDETGVAHVGSYENLLGEEINHSASYSPDLLVSDKTPPAFIWHTSNDNIVNVINSYHYGKALREHGVLHEMHIFPSGPHGMGLATDVPYIHKWLDLLGSWLTLIGWYK